MSIKDNQLNFYQPSGKISPASFLYFFTLCLLVIPILAFLYAYIIWSLAALGWGDFFEIANPFFTVGFGYLIAYLISTLVIKRGRVRHPTFASLLGLIGGLVAFYMHWIFWINLVSNNGFEHVFVNMSQPILLWDQILKINATGTWVTHFRSDAPIYWTGMELTAIWIFEAFLIILFAPIKCFLTAQVPYCEIAKRWFTVKILPNIKLIKDPQKLIAALEAGSIDSFSTIEKKNSIEGGENYTKIILYQLNSSKTSYISIYSSIRTFKGWNKIDIVTCAEISDALKDSLLVKLFPKQLL